MVKRRRRMGLMLVMLPTGQADRAFLFAVYAGSQAPGRDLAALWAACVEREGHYKRQCPGAERYVLLWRGARAGAATVCRGAREIRLMDLALLPGFRGRGIGTAVIRALQAEAGAAGRRLGLQVARSNRARRLYERLGFVITGETPSHVSMVWEG